MSESAKFVQSLNVPLLGRPEAIRAALWEVDFTGLNGKIKFQKQGPAGKESGQSMPNVYLIEIKDGKVILPKL